MNTAVIFGLQLLGTLLYAAAALREWLVVRGPGHWGVTPALWLGAGALIVHTVVVAGQVFAASELLNLDLSYALSLFVWLAILQFLLATLFLEVQLLGLILFPLAGVVLLIEAFAPSGESLRLDLSRPALAGHLVLSLLAYGTLTLAAVQAILLRIQEGQLRSKRFGVMARILPALQPMEDLLFHLLRVGFGMLTLVILTGVVFSEQLLGRPLSFDHKTVLSLIAWVVFGLLLWGHRRYGWRGRAAVRWTLSGYGILLLAYFGVRIIMELKA
ncbi:cytochrome C assembly family protein [Thiohalorhabdus sp.]|uniref:cytochrome C assembly family protein n=1 Tax=Thiohalorhabdus sp. TaxID=3094134 RepID=UPI002FC299FB